MMGGFGGCCGGGWLGSLGGFGWAGIVINLLVIIAIVIGVGLLFAWMIRKASMNSSGGYSSMGGDLTVSPKEVLAMRYARGDITRDDYTRMISDLD